MTARLTAQGGFLGFIDVRSILPGSIRLPGGVVVRPERGCRMRSASLPGWPSGSVLFSPLGENDALDGFDAFDGLDRFSGGVFEHQKTTANDDDPARFLCRHDASRPAPTQRL